MIRNLVVILLLIASQSVLADDAGINEGAYGPQPIDLDAYGESPIRMVSEKLDIAYGMKKADVAIDFVFQSTSRSARQQKIGFPDVALAMKEDEHLEGELPNPGMPLENLKTYVQGVEVPDTVEYGKIRIGKTGVWLPPRVGERSLTMAWHTADVAFPAGKPVLVRRTYTAQHGYYPYWYAVFMYFTVTGAQWKGTIGSMDLTVDLMDGLRVSDLEWVPSTNNGYKVTVSPPRRAWTILSPTKMHLLWKDFEPSRQRNRQWFRLVAYDKRMTEEFGKARETERGR